MLTSFKSNLCSFKKPTIKRNLFPIDFIQICIEKEVLPHNDRPRNINLIAVRSIFRAIIMYFTFWRFSDLRILKNADFQWNEQFVILLYVDLLFAEEHTAISSFVNFYFTKKVPQCNATKRTKNSFTEVWFSIPAYVYRKVNENSWSNGIAKQRRAIGKCCDSWKVEN